MQKSEVAAYLFYGFSLKFWKYQNLLVKKPTAANLPQNLSVVLLFEDLLTLESLELDDVRFLDSPFLLL